MLPEMRLIKRKVSITSEWTLIAVQLNINIEFFHSNDSQRSFGEKFFPDKKEN